MTKRIVLSISVLIALGTLILGIAVGIGVHAAIAQDVEPANGIGTSPSADDDPLDVRELASTLNPDACGIWVRDSRDAADAHALAGEPPNVLVFTSGNTTCSDAVAIAAARWPSTSTVRYAVHAWRALGAE